MTKLFYVKNDGYDKVISIFGKNFRFKNISKQLDEQEKKLESLKQEINEITLRNFNYLANLQKVFYLHQKIFPKYKNINKGKNVVLIATGPSLKYFKPIDNVIYVGVNKAFQYDKVNFDYLFLQDYSGSTKSYIKDFCNYGAKKFIGFIPDYIPNAIQSIIPEKYSNYPNVERYYVAHPTEKTTFTFDLATQPFGDAYSIVFPAMQFILWTNPQKIYIVGCDCSTSGYYDSKNQNNLAVYNVFEGWKKMKMFVKTYYPDIEIISINPIGLKGIFKDKFFDKNNNLCNLDPLSNDIYTSMYKEIHSIDKSYGSTSIDFLKELKIIIEYLKPQKVLDYGCGKATLLNKLQELYPEIKFYGYDPSIQERNKFPDEKMDLVINTDVLEHIPENIIPNVVEKISEFSKNVFFALHHAKAKTILPNGENAHITIKTKEWYKSLFRNYFKDINMYDGKYEYTSFCLTFDIPNDISNLLIKTIKESTTE